VTKDGSNARKKAARELAAAEQITYTEALRRVDQRAASGAGRVTRPVATLTTDVVLIGHTGPVYGVAFTRDGRTLASAGDVTARLWDLTTRQNTAVLSGETQVISAALSPDGGTLAVASSDRTISLWAIATGQVTDLTGCAGPVQSVAFSPDGRTLASSELQPRQPGQNPPAPHDNTSLVRLWDLATGQTTTLPPLHGSYPSKALAFDPGGQTLACYTGMDGTIQLLNLATGQATTLTGHTSGIEAAAFSPDGRTLATGGTDTTIRVWDLAAGRSTTLTPHGGYVVSVAFSLDGRTLATAGTDNVVRLWDPATGQLTATLFGHTEFVTSVAFGPDGRTLATAGRDKTVRLWSLGEAP
jgi:WD40 repeat protein